MNNMNKLNSLAVIIDGNRRWARQKNLPTFKGHQQGYDKVKELGDWCLAEGIKFLTVYAFSTENWKRKKTEVNYLMKLLADALKNEMHEFHTKNIRLKISGQKEKLSKELQKLIITAEKLTAQNTQSTLNLCISYGGRPEIVDAVKKIVKSKINPQKITEKTIQENLYSPEIPEPDLIIRTGGEMRLSNFLTWQSVYSELYFSSTLWPAFNKKEFNQILKKYNHRSRRFGK